MGWMMFEISSFGEDLICIGYKNNAILWFDGTDSDQYYLLRNILFTIGKNAHKVQIIGVDEI